MLSNDGVNSSANAAIKIAELLNIDESTSKTILESFHPIKGRGLIYLDLEMNAYIDETYNASPETLKLGVKSLIQEFPDQKKLIISAEILENDPKIVEQTYKEIEELSKDEEKKLRFLNLSKINDEEKLETFTRELNLQKNKKLTEISFRDLKNLNKQNKIKSLVYLKASRAANLNKLLD